MTGDATVRFRSIPRTEKEQEKKEEKDPDFNVSSHTFRLSPSLTADG
jgi:hypothetical protein